MELHESKGQTQINNRYRSSATNMLANDRARVSSPRKIAIRVVNHYHGSPAGHSPAANPSLPFDPFSVSESNAIPYIIQAGGSSSSSKQQRAVGDDKDGSGTNASRPATPSPAYRVGHSALSSPFQTSDPRTYPSRRSSVLTGGEATSPSTPFSNPVLSASLTSTSPSFDASTIEKEGTRRRSMSSPVAAPSLAASVSNASPMRSTKEDKYRTAFKEATKVLHGLRRVCAKAMKGRPPTDGGFFELAALEDKVEECRSWSQIVRIQSDFLLFNERNKGKSFSLAFY
jgi:hypothetical protein